MTTYRLSPFATFVQSHLIAEATQYAVFHRLTGELFELDPSVREFLQALAQGKAFSLAPQQLSQLGELGIAIQKLIDLVLVIPIEVDPIGPFIDLYVGRPLQNPALTYRNETGAVLLVSISMAERIYSPEPGKLPAVTEETLPELMTSILLAADGSKTLRQIYAELQDGVEPRQYDREFRDAIEFLTKPERQLIKFALAVEDFANPYNPPNLVPRNFYHASRWPDLQPEKTIGEFHLEGIDDAAWEFDIIEPTVNHGLRFPTQLLSGQDYGTRFCDAVFSGGFSGKTKFEVLEIGGGTGSFAHSFIQRVQANGNAITYHIMDLSPELAASQRRSLSDIRPPVGHINQDATHFDLPGRKFDLIVSNEVIADFPVAGVERKPADDDGVHFRGEGAPFIEKYSLAVDDAPDHFYVNSGVFQFLERAWRHLDSGGRLILSEYGSETRYPVESFHLNHAEFAIHFGHVVECARKIGFKCRLTKLTEFLGIDDGTPVLNGRDEHILCINCVLQKYGMSLPFGLFSEKDFSAQFGDLVDRLDLSPVRFLPLRNNFHYGPNLTDFFVLNLEKEVL
jgi:putative S-adenosyl-L-methionine-dependent methyltransferase